MREKTSQDYANELLKMYRENAVAIAQSENSVPSSTVPEITFAPPRFEDGTGGLQLNVTTFNHLYPVKNALVTVFTGSGQNKTIIETGITDESGKSGVFKLKTPPVADSQQAENGGVSPYAKYNVSVESDGYVGQIAMNVPVFSGVLSVQGMDLLPITVAGKNTAPKIIEEGNDYNL